MGGHPALPAVGCSVLKGSVVIDLHRHRLPPSEGGDLSVEDLRDMPEVLLLEMCDEGFEEGDLLCKICLLVRLHRCGYLLCFSPSDLVMVLAMLVEARDLPPVDGAVIVGLPMEHVRIEPADSHPLRIDGAAAVLIKEVAAAVILDPEGVPGGVEDACIVAELEVGRRNESLGCNLTHAPGVLVQKEDMAVELAGAAAAATGAGEADILDEGGEVSFGIGEEGFPLSIEVVNHPGEAGGGGHLHRCCVYGEKGVLVMDPL